MLSKAYKTLRENPVLILLHVAYMLVTAFVFYLFRPHQINQNDITELLINTFIMFLTSLVMGILGLIYFTGYSNMIAQAVTAGKTSIGSFFPGIKHFFGRLLLATLLMFSMFVGFSIILSIAIIPVTMMLTFSNQGDPVVAATNLTLIITPFISLCVIAVIPFIILWLPALFIDDTGVIDSMKRGMKAGVKNYGILMLWTAIVYLPAFIYTMMNMGAAQAGIIMAPGYIAMLLVSTILSLFYFIMIFILYKEKRINAGISNV